MVHTFELSCVIDYTAYSELVKLSYPDKKNRYRHICKKLSRFGIGITLYKSELPHYKYDTGTYRCYYTINPTRLYHENDYLGLFATNKLLDIVPEINDRLSELSEKLPKIEECKLTRFDFCVNAEFNSEQTVEDIISLVNRNYVSYIGSCYEQRKIYNNKAKRYSLPKHEATFTKYHEGDKICVEISIYNKPWQLRQFKVPQKTDKNIVRCEIRCFRPYIKRLMKKFGCSNIYNDITDFLRQAERIEEYVYGWQLKKLGLVHDFVRLPAIVATIEQSSYKSKTRRKLTETAVAAASHRSLAASLSELPIDDAKAQVKKFKNLGVSPMPTPHNAAIPDYFNFLEMIMEFADLNLD